jgi:hypothetical protein
MAAVVFPDKAVRRKECCHHQQHLYSSRAAAVPVLGAAAAITANRPTVISVRPTVQMDNRNLVLPAETVVLLVEPAEGLEGLVIPRELDQVLRTVKVRQGLHPAAAAAEATRHLREPALTTVAVVVMVLRVASCLPIRQQQAADEDGEYS